MIYEYWLAAFVKIPARKKKMLRDALKSAENIFYCAERTLRETRLLDEKETEKIVAARAAEGFEKKYEEMKKKGIGFVPYFSGEYPQRLLNIASPPYALYVRGSLPDPDKKSAAIVGARGCSAYGEKYALVYGEYLAKNGVCVISGMARGIDGAGQRGALKGGGKTFAVAGCGPDICYPKENKGLAKDILENGGGIISEFVPGTPPLPENFPIRNRIISGLSDIVLVMEARMKSGSLITADMALEQGKDVYALPGSVESSLSSGCNRLIYQGAGILLSPQTLLEDLGVPVKAAYDNSKKTDKIEKELENEEKLMYSRLALYPKDLNTLINETEIPAKDAAKLLISLELKGYIKEISKNYYIKAF